MPSVNKNAAYVALRPPSSAQLCKALPPVVRPTLCGRCGGIAGKGSLLQTRQHCGARRNMRMAAVCAPAVCFKRSIAGKARRLHVQRRSQRQPHHHSAKQATHSSTLEALGFIDPPSARFVLPPSAPPRLHSLPQRHLLLLRRHGVQRLLGRHAPQRHQQRERRRHQHNRHLELGRAPHPLPDVGEHVVA